MPAPPPNQPKEQALPIADEEVGLQGAAALRAASSQQDVSALVGVPWRTLAWVLYGHGADGYYNTWLIKKKSGGVREIRAPRSILWRAQRELLGILADCYKPRPAAHGFVKGRSVATNARPHVNSRFVLSVDIEDFFPSIHFGRVRGLFMAHPFQCAPEAATVLARICCSHGSLPIGASTSPVVSNMVCVRLDRELQRLARDQGCWYTRYADDLTFSTNRATFPHALAELTDDGKIQLGSELASIIGANGFRPNIAKTRLKTAHDRQLVTGIKVNERPNLDRRYVRRIRGMLHAWHRHGLDKAQEEWGARWDSKDRFPGAAPKFVDVLRGRIAYLAMIRGPSDFMVRRFLDQYDNLKANRDLHYALGDYSPEPYQAEPARDDVVRRRLLTVMFTDIVDSTAQLAVHGDQAWRKIREKHDRLIRSEVRRRWGRIIKWLGDGSLTTFDNPSHAVECAKRIVASVAELGIQVRVGLHTGEVEVDGRDIHGIGVNISARVGALAAASEVLASQTVKDLLEGSGVVFRRRGRARRLKGVPGRWRLFAAVPD